MKEDRGLAQIRRDWIEKVIEAQRILDAAPELPPMISVPEWLGAGDDADAILVHPRVYVFQSGIWKPIEAASPPTTSLCHVSRDDSYKFSDRSDAWELEFPAWRDAIATRSPLPDIELASLRELWLPMKAGFDRSIWMPGRVRRDEVERIEAELRPEIEAVKKWNDDWIAYVDDVTNTGGGLTGDEFSGVIDGIYGCGETSMIGLINIFSPSGRGASDGGPEWDIFKARVLEAQSSLAEVPPAAARASRLLDDLQQAIRPFRHGTQYRFRGE